MADSRLVAMRPVLMVPPNTGVSGLLDVALRQCAGVEGPNQNLFLLDSSATAAATDAPRLRMGRNAGKPSRVGSVTVPFVDSLSSARRQ